MILAPDELNGKLYELTTRSRNISLPVFYYFALCYTIGCRGAEILNNDTMEWNPHTNVLTYEQPKTTILRSIVIPTNDFFHLSDMEFIPSVASEVSFRTYERYFSELRGNDFYKVGTKNGSIHLFRHNFAKQAILNGNTPMQVARLLGLNSVSAANHYINSQIIVL